MRCDGLYHRDIGFPADVPLPSGYMTLRYTSHAKRAAQTDRYGDLSAALPSVLDLDAQRPFEIEIEDFCVVKAVYRIKAGFPNSGLDLILVVRSGLVVTVWANRSNDNHRTLDKRKYKLP